MLFKKKISTQQKIMNFAANNKELVAAGAITASIGTVAGILIEAVKIRELQKISEGITAINVNINDVNDTITTANVEVLKDMNDITNDTDVIIRGLSNVDSSMRVIKRVIKEDRSVENERAVTWDYSREENVSNVSTDISASEIISEALDCDKSKAEELLEKYAADNDANNEADK